MAQLSTMPFWKSKKHEDPPGHFGEMLEKTTRLLGKYQLVICRSLRVLKCTLPATAMSLRKCYVKNALGHCWRGLADCLCKLLGLEG